MRALIACFLALLCVGCAQVAQQPSVQLPGEWKALLDDIRSYQRDIGFNPTRNFVEFSTALRPYPYCGRASPLVLPYSYQDPAIEWDKVQSQTQCRTLGQGMDFLYIESEAVGESAAPLTPAMITRGLARFLYLVVHEDCHDQFNLPHGFEEPLCDVLALKAMTAFALRKYGESSPEMAAVVRYVEAQRDVARVTIETYDEVAALYDRYQRGEISSEMLLRSRAVIYERAEAPLQGEANNVRLANYMTYGRHFHFVESVYAQLGDELPRAVEFFRRVDAIAPSTSAVMKANGLTSERSVQLLRAHEIAVLETVRRALLEAARRSPG